VRLGFLVFGGTTATVLGAKSSAGKLTEGPVSPTLKAMEVHLNPDVQAKLTRLAAEQGRDTEALAQEAIARFVD
jgi:hypothetical protein